MSGMSAAHKRPPDNLSFNDEDALFQALFSSEELLNEGEAKLMLDSIGNEQEEIIKAGSCKDELLNRNDTVRSDQEQHEDSTTKNDINTEDAAVDSKQDGSLDLLECAAGLLDITQKPDVITPTNSIGDSDRASGRDDDDDGEKHAVPSVGNHHTVAKQPFASGLTSVSTTRPLSPIAENTTTALPGTEQFASWLTSFSSGSLIRLMDETVAVPNDLDALLSKPGPPEADQSESKPAALSQEGQRNGNTNSAVFRLSLSSNSGSNEPQECSTSSKRTHSDASLPGDVASTPSCKRSKQSQQEPVSKAIIYLGTPATRGQYYTKALQTFQRATRILQCRVGRSHFTKALQKQPSLLKTTLSYLLQYVEKQIGETPRLLFYVNNKESIDPELQGGPDLVVYFNYKDFIEALDQSSTLKQGLEQVEHFKRDAWKKAMELLEDRKDEVSDVEYTELAQKVHGSFLVTYLTGNRGNFLLGPLQKTGDQLEEYRGDVPDDEFGYVSDMCTRFRSEIKKQYACCKDSGSIPKDMVDSAADGYVKMLNCLLEKALKKSPCSLPAGLLPTRNSNKKGKGCGLKGGSSHSSFSGRQVDHDEHPSESFGFKDDDSDDSESERYYISEKSDEEDSDEEEDSLSLPVAPLSSMARAVASRHRLRKFHDIEVSCSGSVSDLTECGGLSSDAAEESDDMHLAKKPGAVSSHLDDAEKVSPGQTQQGNIAWASPKETPQSDRPVDATNNVASKPKRPKTVPLHCRKVTPDDCGSPTETLGKTFGADASTAIPMPLGMFDERLQIPLAAATDSFAWFSTIRFGHTETARMLLDRGKIAVDITSPRGDTPLLVASEYGQEETARLLLDRYGADVHSRNGNGMSPLHFASKNGHLGTSFLLLDRGANTSATDRCGRTPLHLASMNGHEGTARLLLARLANINAKDGTGSSSLHFASHEGNRNLCRLLIRRGADVNITDEKGKTPLHHASQRGKVETVRYLLEHGADVNATSKDGAAAGMTPLHVACAHGHSATVRLLWQFGAWINAKDGRGRTPLYYACMGEHWETARMLIEGGAQVNATDHVTKSTPLHLAGKRGHFDTTLLLLCRGASIIAKDQDDMTPMHYATQNGPTATARLFVSIAV